MSYNGHDCADKYKHKNISVMHRRKGAVWILHIEVQDLVISEQLPHVALLGLIISGGARKSRQPGN